MNGRGAYRKHRIGWRVLCKRCWWDRLHFVLHPILDLKMWWWSR